jgi:hypothetical protein
MSIRVSPLVYRLLRMRASFDCSRMPPFGEYRGKRRDTGISNLPKHRTQNVYETATIQQRNYFVVFFFFAGSSSSASVFLFSEILLLLRVPSVRSFPLPFNAPSFLAAPPLAAPFFESLTWSFFLLLLALGFCSLGGGSSSSLSFGDGLSGSFSVCFSSAFFLVEDLGCGVPFLGSFFDPDSFS